MSSSGSRDRAGDRLSPLESVVTDSAHENPRIASGQSRSSLDNPRPDSIEIQQLSQHGQDSRGTSEPLNNPNEAQPGTSNPTALVNPFGGYEDKGYREQFQLIQPAKVQLERQREVLGRLKAWHDWDENRHKSLRNFLLSKVGYPRRPSRPGYSELIELAFYCFLPPATLEVIICDYGHDRFNRFEVELGKIESGMCLILA